LAKGQLTSIRTTNLFYKHRRSARGYDVNLLGLRLVVLYLGLTT